MRAGASMWQWIYGEGRLPLCRDAAGLDRRVLIIAGITLDFGSVP